MSHTLLNPSDLHDPTAFGYSHTAAVAADSTLIFVSGQYASDSTGALVANTFQEQVDVAFSNLARALAAHHLDLTDVIQLRTYVVGLDFDKLGTIGQFVGTTWGAKPPTQTVLGVAALALPEILFEVEAIAASR